MTMNATTPSRRARLSGVSLAALVLALGTAAPAVAPSFQGTGTVVSGSASITNGAGTTDISVNTQETIIDWSVTAAGGAPVVFQTGGTTATFHEGISFANPDFTVLNRIMPENAAGTPVNAAVQFDGTVNSTLFGLTGGNVWFYSPNGIIVGATGAFNVGGLVLTTNPIDTTGGLYGAGGQIRFNGAAGSLAPVTIQGSITALANPQADTPAYVAVVAPVINQGGAVSAEGSVAYVAAEAAEITMNAGLFNISVSAGTTDATGITHSGSTTGSAVPSGGDPRTIYMVAVPKNDGLTMLLGGTMGYASTASNDGTAVVLAAGRGIGYDTSFDPSVNPANISIGDADFTSRLTALATDTITVAPTDITSFERFASLGGYQRVELDLSAGGSIQALATDGLPPDIFFPPFGTQYALDVKAGYAETGGTIVTSIDNGGSFSADGIVRMRATGDANTGAASSTTGTGGAVNFDIVNGDFSAYQLAVDASGYGGGDGSATGDGVGGSIDLTLGGTMSVDSMSLVAEGIGSSVFSAGSGTGGNGTGGGITVRVNGGTLLTDVLDVTAGGSGGSGSDFGGTGRGGTVNVTVEAGGSIAASSAGFSSTAYLSADGGGGDGQVEAGDGYGGAVTLTANNGTLDFSYAGLFANGRGSGSSGLAGDGFGGSAVVNIIGQDQNWGYASINANAYAGGAFDNAATGGSAFADAVTGAQINIDGATLTTTSSTSISANAIGDFGGVTAGTGTAGRAALSITNGGAWNAQGTVSVSAFADFEIDSVSGDPLSTPDMNGGTALVTIDGGSLSSPALFVQAYGTTMGGLANAGSARGGSATLTVLNGGTLTIDPALSSGSPDLTGLVVDAAGAGDLAAFFGSSFNTPADGYGAAGTGGTARIQVVSGAVSVAGSQTTVDASGTGGPAGLASAGNVSDGDGTGGTASVTLNAGSLTFDNGLGIVATGTGGEARNGLAGGTGTGGSATFRQTGGTTTINPAGSAPTAFTINAVGSSSAIELAQAGTAGNAIGGTASLQVGGGTLNVTGSASVLGYGAAGDSLGGPTTIGGTGTGGSALIDVFGTGTLDASGLTLTASAYGAGSDAGTTGFGGLGTGGTATIQTRGNGSLIADTLAIDANGLGGDNALATTTQGRGIGGTAALFSSGGSLVVNLDATLDANGIEGATPGAGTPTTVGGFIDVGSALVTGGGVFSIGGTLRASALGDAARADGQGLRIRSSLSPLQVSGNASFDVTGSGAITLRTGSPLDVAGTLLINSRAGSITQTGTMLSGGDTQIHALGSLALDVINANSSIPGDSSLTADTGTLSANAVSSATGTLTITALGDVDLGDVTASGNIDISSQAAGLSTSGLVQTTSGGTISLFADQNVSLADVTSASTLSVISQSGGITGTGLLTGTTAIVQATLDVLLADVTAGTVSITSFNGSVGSTGLLAADNTLSIDAFQNVALASAQAGGSLDLTAQTGALSATGLISSDGPASIDGHDGVTLVDASATQLSIGSLAGDVVSTGTINSTVSTFIDAAGSVGVNFLSSNGSLNVTAQTGGINAANAMTGNAVTLDAQGDINLASVQSQSLDVLSRGGSVRAGGALTADATTLTLVAQQDIAIADASALQQLDLRAVTGSVTATGAIGTGNGFNATIQGASGVSLGTADIGRTLTITSSGGGVTASGLLTSRSLTAPTGISITAQGNIGLAGTLASSPLVLTSTTGGITSSALLRSFGSASLTARNGITLTGGANADGALGITSQTGALAATGALVSGGGAIDVNAASGITLGSANAGTTLQLQSSGGGLSATGLLTSGQATTINVRNAISLAGVNASGPLSITSSNGALTATGTLNSGGNTLVNAVLGITVPTLVSGGTTTLRAGNGAIRVNALTSPGLVSARGGSVTISSPGALAFSDADGSSVTVTTVGNLTMGALDAGNGSAALTSSSGGVTLGSTANSGGDLSVNAATAILASGPVTTGGAVTYVAGGAVQSNGTITAGGDVAITAGTSIVTGAPITSATQITMDAGTGITTAALTATNRIALDAGGNLTANGDLTATNEIDLRAAQAIVTNGNIDPVVLNFTSGTSLTINGSAQGTNIGMDAGTDIIINGALTADDTLSGTAGGTVFVNSLLTAPTINLASSDIAISANGQIGLRGTTSAITLVNGGGGDTFLGGTGTTAGYSLDASEILRLRSDQSTTLAVAPVSSGVGDVIVDDFSFLYGANSPLGTGGTFAIRTPGTVRVIGRVDLATGDDNDTFSIEGDRVDVIADRGFIGLIDDGGAPLGTLRVIANRFAVATDATLSALDGLTDIVEINTLLDTPPTQARDGVIVAGLIDSFVYDGIYVQNMGPSDAFADRRGFVANQLALGTAGPDTQIVINGLTLDAAGTYVTGLDTVGTITINDLVPGANGQFAVGSSVNGCVIGDNCAAGEPHQPTEPELTGPLDPGGPLAPFTPTTVVIDINPIGQDALLPLVDEPVTSVGNEDLWGDSCPNGQDNCKGDTAK